MAVARIRLWTEIFVYEDMGLDRHVGYLGESQAVTIAVMFHYPCRILTYGESRLQS